ncbi:MAG TPA: outer membrane protein assembly factor BamD [Gemmatimonadales bacterium]|nr:outer membrane protein assembly factor BamD [Gemmatimonadales bacterium]
MIRRCLTAAVLLMAAACARGTPAAAPTPVTPVAGPPAGTVVPANLLDSLAAELDSARAHRKWDQVITLADRLALELPPGDARATRTHLYRGEAYFEKHDYLQAAREFRRVSDENPLDPLAPEGLLRVGDAYARLWRRPELDATYGQTALATYQELLTRYPTSEVAKQAQARITELNDKFALKAFKSAQYYMRLKAYDSAIIYFKDLVVSYPRAAIVPSALVRLIDAYRSLNYQEDVQETCDYLRKYHSASADAMKACAGVPAPAAASAPSS